MDFLKKFWPYSFQERTEVSQLVIAVIIQVLIGWVAGLVLGFIGGFLGGLVGGFLGGTITGLFGLVGSILGLYFTAGIVFSFLSYFKVLK